MAHTMSEGATGEGPSLESREGEYTNILTELRLTHQALEDQIYQFERLSQEISAIKAQLGLRLPIETVTSLVDGERFSVEQEKTLLETCLALISSVNALKKDHESKNSYAHQLALLDRFVDELKARMPAQPYARDCLSVSELRIVSMIKMGMTTERIAERLHISADTVKTHRRNIRRKLDIVGKKHDLASHLRVGSEGHTSPPKSGTRESAGPLNFAPVAGGRGGPA